MTPPPARRVVDVRGTRFGGALTTAVSIAALATLPALAFASLALTTLLGLILLAGALGGPAWNLWGHAYRTTLARRLGPPQPHQREPVEPPRFANLVGGVVLVGAVAAQLAGIPWLAALLVAIVAALAALNATTGLCVGCRLYGLLVLRPRARAAQAAADASP